MTNISAGASGAAALPIRRLTLYKHGVSFVERQGAIPNDIISLTFRAEDINDALKSLLVIDRGGGQVVGIHYDTPADKWAHTGAFHDVSDDHALIDLLRRLRGHVIRLVSNTEASPQTFTGRLLGVTVGDEIGLLGHAVISLLDETSGAVLTLPLQNLPLIYLLEEQTQVDLNYFLETSRQVQTHRTISISLSEGPHDLAVSYLIPSPTWRVSYRLVAAPTLSAPAARNVGSKKQPAGEGVLLLQGWGLFDNRLDEDLHDVSVSLVAGQPISFVYDLAASHIPRRAVIADTARVVSAPVEYAGAVPTADLQVVSATRSRAARKAPTMLASSMMFDELADQEVAATGSDAGELFQYQVVAPVTVKRGESALVPIMNTQLPYQRELLFNEHKLREHPVSALRFNNHSGLVLERGPVTVLEDGVYRGEAIVPFTKEEDEVYLAFAVELGIKVAMTTTMDNVTAGLRISGAVLDIKQALVRRTTYHLDNNLTEERAVTIEHPMWSGTDLIESRPPDSRTADAYRWIVPCPPRKATIFTVAERQYTWQSSQLLDQAFATLQDYARNNWLDRATLARLRALLDERAAIARNAQEISRLESEREGIFQREQQLRENLGALSAAGDEGTLRQQVVARLQTSEDRLNAIDASIVALKEENNRRQATIDVQLRALEVADTTGDKQ